MTTSPRRFPNRDISGRKPGTTKALVASPSIAEGAYRTSTGVVMYVWLALFLIVADVSAAFAQGHQGTSQEQKACSRDASRLCRKDLGNDGAVQACLQQNRSRLSAACDRVFKSHGM